MVPLNFGAAAPLMLKLHFEHVCAVSGFCVPQFGQNTRTSLAAKASALTSGQAAPGLSWEPRA
jgi:hypothetical protein